MKLSDLNSNETGIITKVKGRGAFRRRITEMGFIKGKEVTVVKTAPLKDPIEYKIMGYELSLRRSEANLIEVITHQEAKELADSYNYDGVINGELWKKTASDKGKTINVALVGNPNAGKTSLFNFASKSREHVGNYSGVTVDSKKAKFKQNGYTFNIVDLPGTYSISAVSPDELYVRKYILGEVPDIVINVLDSSNLERNLFLTTQLIDMDIKVVVALNMYDDLMRKGAEFDFDSLGKMIGIPFMPTICTKGDGIVRLFDKVIEVFEDKSEETRHIHINYGKEIEKSITKIQSKIKQEENYFLTDKISSRFLAIKSLEKDPGAEFTLTRCKNFKEIEQTSKDETDRIESIFGEESETLITDAKYGFIAGALKETYKEGGIGRRRRTEIIDTILTHKLFGFPVFVLFLWIMFHSTFSIGAYPMEWIEAGVSFISDFVSGKMADGPLKDLLIDGVIGGVGGVIVFLPNILILFLFISFMEDTGYMSRAAFIMDKLMHKIGLHGKSFIPLIMGFGCNVPAIMATRTLENRNDRILTMLINPFMSCSARLPVYILILGTFFPDNTGSMLFLVYFIGIFLAIIFALIFKRLFKKKEEVPFVMELPTYRIPTIRSTFRHMWHKASQYLQKMGGVILIASIIIWALGYFPQDVDYSKDFDSEIASLEEQIGFSDTISLEFEKLNSALHELRTEKLNEKQEQSYIGKIGKSIQPVMNPLGFDWRLCVSLVSGVAAKEIVVSTLGVLYNVSETDLESNTLPERLRNARYDSGPKKGQKVFNPVVAFSFLMFILIYFPCVAVIAAIRKESGSWRWAVFTIFYTTSLAWIVSFLSYQIGSLFI